MRIIRCLYEDTIYFGYIEHDLVILSKDLPRIEIHNHEKGLKGAEVTPYLLSRVADLTGGDSLEANIALVLNNARLAAKIAKA